MLMSFGPINVYCLSLIMILTGFSKTSMSRDSNKKSSLPIAGLCTLLIAYLLLLVLVVFSFFAVREVTVPAYEGDTIFLRDVNEYCGSKIQLSETPYFGDITAHNCSTVPRG